MEFTLKYRGPLPGGSASGKVEGNLEADSQAGTAIGPDCAQIVPIAI